MPFDRDLQRPRDRQEVLKNSLLRYHGKWQPKLGWRHMTLLVWLTLAVKSRLQSRDNAPTYVGLKSSGIIRDV